MEVWSWGVVAGGEGVGQSGVAPRVCGGVFVYVRKSILVECSCGGGGVFRLRMGVFVC